MRVSVAVVGLAGLLGGCGGSSGGATGSLDCSYLAGANCWKTTTAMASSCLPPPSETGVLSADGSTCTYASGDVVTFTPPVVFPIPDMPKWNFTVKTGSGAPCLSYVDDASGGITLTVQGQTVKETVQGALGLKLSCPDGSSYANANAFNLLSCPDAGLFGDLPGVASSFDDRSVSLSLAGSSASPSDETVFSCRKTTSTP